MDKLSCYVGTVCGLLTRRGHRDLSRYCTDDFMHEEWYNHDNWDGGIDFYNILIEVPVSTFGQWESEEGGIEKRENILLSAFEDAIKGDESIVVSHVFIRPSSSVVIPKEEDSTIDFSDLRFEVQTKCGDRSDRFSGVQPPSMFPSFVLNHNDNWNDYGCKTWYSLFYYKNPDEAYFIGELKIMNRNDDDTQKVIPNEFDHLNKDFCSLGIRTTYYKGLRKCFNKDDCERILLALKDCAISIEQYETYKDHKTFIDSLERDLDSERARRQAKFIINGRNLEDAYNIQYLFSPKYNQEMKVPFRLKFNNQKTLFGRCAGVIGENGVGKTIMMGGLIDALINRKYDKMECDMPLFSSVVAICTTPFDCFADIHQETSLNLLMPYYYFCANQQKDKVIGHIISAVNIIRRRRIKTTGLFGIYDKTIKDEIKELNSFNIWEEDDTDAFNPKLIIHDDELENAIKCLSSGQLQMFMLITFIFSKINFDALLVIDEPEVHLHPNAINKLFKLLAKLLCNFQCFCIVATHSPLIVREISGDFVYIMRRQEKILTIGKIGKETLGEDISTLYESIFGYDEGDTSLAKIIKKKKRDGCKNDDIVQELTSSESVLSVNTRMLINRIMNYEEN